MVASKQDVELVRVGPQGRIVVPVDLRRELGLDEGSLLAAKVVQGTLVLEPREAILRRWQGRFRAVAPGVSLADELIEDRRRETEAEMHEP